MSIQGFRRRADESFSHQAASLRGIGLTFQLGPSMSVYTTMAGRRNSQPRQIRILGTIFHIYSSPAAWPANRSTPAGKKKKTRPRRRRVSLVVEGEEVVGDTYHIYHNHGQPTASHRFTRQLALARSVVSESPRPLLRVRVFSRVYSYQTT